MALLDDSQKFPLQVILAERKNTRQLCAIKIVKKKDVLKEDTAETSLLERDVLALGRQCRFITTLFAAFQSTERLFFVMEFVSGGDLFHHIAKVAIATFSTSIPRLVVFLSLRQNSTLQKLCLLFSFYMGR